MVKAGKPVDEVMDELIPHLEEGDIIIDGGNSFFTDTARRYEACEEEKIRFVGMGVSGGEEGALEGPSMMPGGDREAWDRIAPMLTKMAAQVDGTPCCTYIGPQGAGHYVKMVHNGIEYADMQLIAEAIYVFHQVVGFGDELHVAVLDAVVDHLDEMARPAVAAVGDAGHAIAAPWRRLCPGSGSRCL